MKKNEDLSELTNGELIEKLRNRITQSIEKNQDILPDEFLQLKAILIDCVTKEKDFYKLKMMFQYYFGLQGESPEMIQLQNLQLNWDKRFETLQKEYEKQFDFAQRERNINRYAIIGLGVLGAVSGAISPYVVEFFFKLFGWV